MLQPGGRHWQLIDLISMCFSGETGLHIACRRGHLARVAEFMSDPNVDVNTKDNFGWTPLHEAVSHGKVSTS
jgi:ankyrin repeat protein